MPRDRRDPRLIRAGRERPVRSELPRLRVGYQKAAPAAYLSHLEVISAVTRSVRRSGLPFSVGNGFARRVRLQFSSSLPVGASSASEWYDLLLEERPEASEALECLAASTPAALAPFAAGYVPARLPALEAWLNRARWRARVSGADLDPEGLSAAVGEVADKGALDFLRGDKPKHVDLTRTLLGWDTAWGAQGVALELDVRDVAGSAALRPAALLAAVSELPAMAGRELHLVSLERVGQWHEGADGSLITALPALKQEGKEQDGR